ncbi:hypothetical protein ACFFUR_04640 [Echinicola jeungdonensis]|uniref:Uncharacterized protein n=1 Tax=Echinicola jeungdonensis TaxID=709343 RepID=A0ABV5J2N7_9BACT
MKKKVKSILMLLLLLLVIYLTVQFLKNLDDFKAGLNGNPPIENRD